MIKRVAIPLILTSVVCTAGCTAADKPKGADLLLTNGKVYGHAAAQSVVVTDGKIDFIGSENAAEDRVGSNTQVIDLKGKLLLPGFIDNHSHLGEGGEVTCLPQSDLDIEQQASRLAKCAADVPAGQWIIGYGMTLDNVLGFDDLSYRPLDTLDRIFPNNPVIIMEHSSHAMFVNSLALEAAGIDQASAHPQGGKIMRDDRGQINGVLVDNAGDIVMEIAVNDVKDKFDVFYEGILYGLEEAGKNGITTVGDGRTYWRRGMFEAWQSVEQNGDLTARVSMRPWIYPTVDQAEQLAFLETALQDDLTRSLIVNQVKMYSDGVPENGTARVQQPYTWTWFPDTPNGINYIPQAHMEDWLIKLSDLGFGAHIHAIGDLGVKETLNAIASARDAGSMLPYNMTHVFMVDPSDIPRFAALSVDADIQIEAAVHTHADHQHDYIPYIGVTRAAQLAYRPIKALADSGANVTLSSDWTVHPMSPMLAISYAVSEGSLTVDDAIDAYTINAAAALGLEEITGSIEVGKSADFAILDRDITAIRASDILNAGVEMTIYKGQVVYQP